MCQGVIYGCTDLQVIFCQATRSEVLVRMYIMTDMPWHCVRLCATVIVCLTSREPLCKHFRVNSEPG